MKPNIRQLKKWIAALDMYTYVTNLKSPLQGVSIKKEYAETMPHLFKKLEWWEDLKPEDMPEYIKCIKTPDQIIMPGEVLKVIWSEIGGKVENGPWVFPYTNCYLPATEAEYLEYIKQK